MNTITDRLVKHISALVPILKNLKPPINMNNLIKERTAHLAVGFNNTSKHTMRS